MFKQRHCFPLVRPCISQTTLHTLKDIPSSNLRPQFLEQIHNLRENIYKNIMPKQLYNSQISGKQFSELIRCYVKMINQSNFVTGLSVTWQQIQANQRQQIVFVIEQQINKKISQYQKLMPLGNDEFERLNKQIKLIIAQNINTKVNNDQQIKLIYEQIQQVKKLKQSKLIAKNNDKIKQKCQNYLNDYYKQLFNKMLNLAILDNFNDMFNGQIQKLRKNYQLRFKSYQSNIVNQQYTTIIQKIANDLIPKIVMKWSEEEGKKIQKFQQLRKQKKNLQSQMRQKMGNEDSLSKQLSIAKKMYDQSLKQISNYIEVIGRMQKITQNLKKQFQILQQSQSLAKDNLQLKTLQFNQQLRKQTQKTQILQLQLENQKISNNSKADQIQALKKQIKLQKQVHQQQLTTKVEGVLIVLNSQRQHFQQLLIQRNEIESDLKKQLQTQRKININTRQQLTQSISSMKIEFQKTITEIDFQNNQKIYDQQSVIVQLNKKVILLETQNQKLYQQYEHKIEEGETKNQKLTEIKAKMRQNQKLFSGKQEELTSQIENLKKINQKLSKEIQKFQRKIQQINEQNKIILDRNKQQLQIMNKKMQQNVQNYQTNSKVKYELLKKQFTLQKQQIVNKLTQAAERIQKMSIKQQKFIQKIQNYEQQIKIMKQKIIHYENYQSIQCVNKQIKIKSLQNQYKNIEQNNIQLKQIIELQMQEISRYKTKPNGQNQKQTSQQNKEKIKQQGILIQASIKNGIIIQQNAVNTNHNEFVQNLTNEIKKYYDQNNRLKMISKKKQQIFAQTIQTYKTKLEKLLQINQNIKRQLKEVKIQKGIQIQNYSPHFNEEKPNRQNPQNSFPISLQLQKLSNSSLLNTKIQLSNKVQILTQQNKGLKQQLQEQKQKVDKLRTQSFKQINLHAFFKKAIKDTNDMPTEYQNQLSHKQNIFNKTCQQNMSNGQNNINGHINWSQKLSIKQKIIQNLQKKIDELTDNEIKSNRKIHQLNNILIKQRDDLVQLQQQLVKLNEQLNYLRVDKQNVRNKLQQKIAQYRFNCEKSWQEMQSMTKKYNCLNRETQLWKMKALQHEKQKSRPQRNGGYKQKIDQLFNKI